MVSKRQLEQQLAQARAELAEALERNRPDNDPEAFKVHTFSNERHSIATWQEAAEEYRTRYNDLKNGMTSHMGMSHERMSPVTNTDD
jgi:hypothetical protein